MKFICFPGNKTNFRVPALQNSVKAMHQHQQERTLAEVSTTTDERLLAALDQIELLCEQVESLKLHLEYKDLELQETRIELKHTNRELCSALMFDQVSFAEALELATEILSSKRYANKSLSQLLNAIYGSQVKPEELEKIERSSITRIARTRAITDLEAANLKSIFLRRVLE